MIFEIQINVLFHPKQNKYEILNFQIYIYLFILIQDVVDEVLWAAMLVNAGDSAKREEYGRGVFYGLVILWWWCEGW